MSGEERPIEVELEIIPRVPKLGGQLDRRKDEKPAPSRDLKGQLEAVELALREVEARDDGEWAWAVELATEVRGLIPLIHDLGWTEVESAAQAVLLSDELENLREEFAIRDELDE